MAAFFRTLFMYWMEVPENDGCRHFKTSKYGNYMRKQYKFCSFHAHTCVRKLSERK